MDVQAANTINTPGLGRNRLFCSVESTMRQMCIMASWDEKQGCGEAKKTV